MTALLRVLSPVDGRLVAERPLADAAAVADRLAAARRAQPAWARVPLAERVACCRRFVECFSARRAVLAEELTLQMGRPLAHAPGEIARVGERALYMAAIAEESLAELPAPARPGFRRFVRREPLGVVLTVAPWSYPYLGAVNSVVPALLAGNAVVLRHSAQTPLCAERFAEAFAEAGLPAGVLQVLHCDRATLERVIAAGDVDQVVFSGSVGAGRAVERAAAGRFLGVALELGGKDAAYVRPDADLRVAIPELVYGAFYNAGQSCASVERIYVHADVYAGFVDGYVQAAGLLNLGDPLDPSVTLGPLVRACAAEHVRAQTAQALAAGARGLLDRARFRADAPGTPYLAPQVLVDVDHGMRVMTEASFGPVVGIMRVASDDEAVARMNDSAYGLTASVWTQDPVAAVALGERVQTGTWFMNRCDYADPALAWSGVKDSGRGCVLSPLGFAALTRPKSFHLRTGLIGPV